MWILRILITSLITALVGAKHGLRRSHSKVVLKRSMEGEGECTLRSKVNTCPNTRSVFACDESEIKFEILMLGVKGGVSEENLSSYAVRKKGHNDKYVLLDGGSVHAGLRKAREKGNFGTDDREHESAEDLQKFWKHDLKAILVGHTHLDHLSGMSIAMTEGFMQRSSRIYGLPWIINHLKSSMFNDVLWPKALLQSVNSHANGNQGWVNVDAGTEIDLLNSGMKVTPMRICHGNPARLDGEDTKMCFPSTAYLLKTNEDDASLLYFSDVGPFAPIRMRIKSEACDVDKCVPDYASLATTPDVDVPSNCQRRHDGTCTENCRMEVAQTSTDFLCTQSFTLFLSLSQLSNQHDAQQPQQQQQQQWQNTAVHLSIEF